MEKLYVLVPQGTEWLDDLLMVSPEMIDSGDVVICKTLDGSYVYFVDNSIVVRDERQIAELV